MLQYVVKVDTTDLAASKRHAGQLHLAYTEVPGEQWPALRLQGGQVALEWFLAYHCGSTDAGLEYFASHARLSTVIENGDLVENVDGPGSWQYGIVTCATPNDQGQVLVRWNDGRERWFNPCHLSDTTSEDIKSEDAQAWAVLEPLMR